MIVRSTPDTRTVVHARAPLRLGLGGGGTDLSPYCDTFGGAVLNVTIDRFVDTVVHTPADGQVRLVDHTMGESWEGAPDEALDADDGRLRLHRAVYRRVVRDFNAGRPFPVTITTESDTPAGSGLGASSTLAVAMVAACAHARGLTLGPHEMARLAFDIERRDARLPGGRQDQYAAAFGGLNFLEFRANDEVAVTPVRLDPRVVARLEASLLLYHSGLARDSSLIIREQQRRMSTPDADEALRAMHELKAAARRMRACLHQGDFDAFHETLNRSWSAKKRTAHEITNHSLDAMHAAAMSAGASAAKVSGAGGGGFLALFVDPARRAGVIRALDGFAGRVLPARFAWGGCHVRTLD